MVSSFYRSGFWDLESMKKIYLKGYASQSLIFDVLYNSSRPLEIGCAAELYEMKENAKKLKHIFCTYERMCGSFVLGTY